jgi:hypothetical protein
MESDYKLGLTCVRCEKLLELSLFEEDSDMCTECKNKKQKYDLLFLESYCRVKEIQLTEEYKSTNRETRINGICVMCKGNFSKTFRQLVKSGALCDTCTGKIRYKKMEITCLQRYNVKNASQSTLIKDKKKQTCMENYNVPNPSQSEEVKERKRQTCMENFGVENSIQSDIVKDKIKATVLKRYGVETIMNSAEMKAKIKATSLRKYGIDHPFKSTQSKDKAVKVFLKKYGVRRPFQLKEMRDKGKLTLFKNYGVNHPSKSQIIREKVKNTNIERYGVPNAMQNPDIVSKAINSSFKMKNYTFPSGHIIQIQGYEHFALDELVKDGYTEEDIVTGIKNVPNIWYEDSEGVKHVHYPDIWISSENRLIEVKSTWTFKIKKDNVTEKQKMAQELGYRYEIWVYTEKGKKEIIE